MLKKVNLRSIRSKLIISLIAICVLPLYMLGTVAYFQAKAIMTKKFEVTSKQTLEEVNRGLDNYFNTFAFQITMLSSNVNFRESQAVPERIDFAKSLLKDVKESDANVFSTYFGTEDGRFIIYPEGEMPKDFNHKERSWYKDAINNKGNVTVSEPFKDTRTQKLVVSVSKTVEYNGKIVGVVSENIDFENLSKNMSKIKIGNNGYVFVTDKQGIMLAHPKTENLGTDVATKQGFWNTVKSKNSGMEKYTYEGANKYATFLTNEKTNWKLIAAMDEGEIKGDISSFLSFLKVIQNIVTVIVIFVAVLISRGIAKNIKELNTAFNSAAEGDLTVRVNIKSKDEFGTLGGNFSKMMDNISRLMSEVEASAKTVMESSVNLASVSEETSASIEQVSHAINEIAEGATETAQSAQWGAEKINNLSQGIDKITVSTEDMDLISKETQKLGGKGLELIELLGEKSDRTKISATQVGSIVSDMNKSTEEISSISDAISQITEQTNLLSLNASIEAARAGEAGRGFAVVADEIRKLAEQSKNSTVEIKKIIESIQAKSHIAVKAMGETELTVREQEETVRETQKVFDEIIGAVNILVQRIEEVKIDTLNIKDQRETVIEQMENISSISEETASGTEEVSASAQQINLTMEEVTRHVEQLKELSEKLQQGISKFNLA